MKRARTRQVLPIVFVLACGLAGTAVALGARGADSQFLYAQQNPQRVRVAEVERVVRTAPDPAVGRGAGVSARCRPRGTGDLRNPWACTVRYATGRRARLTVRIQADGSYTGRYRAGGQAGGCCVRLPGG